MAKAPFMAANCQRLQEKSQEVLICFSKQGGFIAAWGRHPCWFGWQGRIGAGFTEHQTQVAEVGRMGELGTLSEGSVRNSQYSLDKRVT